VIGKCVECGNTFKIEIQTEKNLVSCPICEATYEAVVTDGKIHLRVFIYEGEDPGEL